MVYSEPSTTTYFDVININHHHHHDHHHHLHSHHNHVVDHPHTHPLQTTTPITPNQAPPIKTTEEDEDELVEDGDEDGETGEEGVEEEEDEDDEDGDEDDDDDVGDDDEAEEDDEDDDDDEEEEEDDDDDDDDGGEDDSSSDDIVDPGQNCQINAATTTTTFTPLATATSTIITITTNQQQQHQHSTCDENNGDLIARDDDLTTRETTAINDILDGERMLEVTRKLVRNTERDPDRDLRKQVLLKTAIKKLPHFMEYNRYTDSLDRSFHSNISPQAYYEHHDQQKFYHSVQPNAIQMSTTSLRMLDLNDDQDPELSNIEQDHVDPNLSGYNTRTSLEQHDYVSQHQYDRYHHQRNQHDLNHFENGNPMISRHNSIDNLYQPLNGSDINEDIKDGNDERIPIAFQIACEIYDFTCAPDDNERKLLDNLTNGYYTRPTKESRTNNIVDDGGGEDGTESRDQDVSDTSSSSQSSTSSSSSSDESANSIASQSTESDEVNGTSLLEASLNSTSDFYHNSHDSGVALFSPRSNKRSSSLIGLDDEMEIDHLTELSTRSPSIGSTHQYKKLRKREIID